MIQKRLIIPDKENKGEKKTQMIISKKEKGEKILKHSFFLRRKMNNSNMLIITKNEGKEEITFTC